MSITIGSWIKIINMIDEPHYQDRVGIVTQIDHSGQVFGTWGGLPIILDIDQFEVIDESLVPITRPINKKTKKKKIIRINYTDDIF